MVASLARNSVGKTAHFGGVLEKVAKIVQCGEHYSLVVEQEATREMASSLIRTLFHILLETKFPGSRCDHLRPRRAFF